MTRTSKIVLAGAAAVAVAAGLAGPALAGGHFTEKSAPKQLGHSAQKRLDAVGLTADRKLVSFSVDKPWVARSYTSVKGLQGDQMLIGIDYRVQDGKLYGVGDRGGVYTIKPASGATTKVSQLTVALDGTTFGVDFNPAADRLRVVSDTGQNLRHDVNPAGTTIADTTLTYPPATAAAKGITAAAYTNNDLDMGTGTTLYDIDTALDQVAIQAPANAGQLSVIGKLGVDADEHAGFDIYSSLRNGKADDAMGYAVLKTGGRTGLYEISLFTGQATKIGTLPNSWKVTDLAVGLTRR